MKGILVIDMPKCCDECFALDDNGDYPMCLITHEQRGYNFNTRNQKMNKCPFKAIPKKKNKKIVYDTYDGGVKHGIVYGWNACIDELINN